MPYVVLLLDEFAGWLGEQEEPCRERVLAHLKLLQERGPLLGRPYADTLKGSKITNLKELRVQYKTEPIRILFAFDPKSQAVIILGSSKRGDKRWYEEKIPIAETLYLGHLEKQRKTDEEATSKEKEK
ncbi:MAG: type II toxin-antitoxin system RelE/ParE family toxin [Cyanobacteria bacterium SZAS TMP-1]|nr:type II toxin-antitoxin system RelE/ParE family toxin [Cyanobacteria bacterium SZAS TMP-1]